MKKQISPLWKLLLAFTTALPLAEGQSQTYSRVNVNGEDFGIVLATSIWTDKTIFVCWENPSDQFAAQMQWVREAVRDTWETHSAVSFSGWGTCSEKNAGIRIRIADDGPHVKDLGRFLDAKPDGMVLNFTYENWSPSCRTTVEYCTRAIAVHEFGHALGFAHEQNRFDAPGECQVERQGTDGDIMLTPYDPMSVMNYCNPKYNNDGLLSEKDIVSVQQVYCARDRLCRAFRP